MRQLPKAIPELDGGLFVPRPVVDLLDALLTERGTNRPPSSSGMALGSCLITDLQEEVR